MTQNNNKNGASDITSGDLPEEVVVQKKIKFPKSGDAIFSNPDIFSKPEDILLNHGYCTETHEVESEDGYFTTLFRIPYGKGQTEHQTSGHQRPTVLFVHGIVTNGISWVFNSDENVLAYQLSNLGFDVWLFNARGTEYSIKHKKMCSSSRKYWQFSWNEMGRYDIPAIIRYILKTAEQERLIYVGHSMGCALLFVACSFNPVIASKIKLMVAYAPAVFLSHSTTPFVKLAARIPGCIPLLKMYHGEVYAKPVIKIMKKFWIGDSRIARDSAFVLWKVMGPVNGKDDEQLNWPIMPVIAAHIPSPTSCRTYEHFLQTHKSGKFRQFDFGRSKNLRVYGTRFPPEYDLQKSTFPVGIFYGDNDACVPPEDIQILAQELPNVQLLHRVNWPQFNHVGFIFAKDANELLNSYVLDLISKNL